MKLMRNMTKVPGGMMLIPLLLGAVIHTVAPTAGTFFGSFTAAFFTGLSAILAVFFFCLGATLEIRATPHILRKGGVLLGSKILFALLVGVIAGQLLGEAPVAAGPLAGLSTLAIVASLNDTNGGLYVSLMGQYGRRQDAGAYSVMSLESGPFLTMVTLGVAGLSAFPWQALVGAILPLVLGMVVGNLDRDFRNLLAPVVPAMIPFLGLGLGVTIDLRDVVTAGFLGVAVGVFVVLVGGSVLFLSDRLTGGDGVAGLAAATTAGNAAIVPAVVAEANPVYEPAAGPAAIIVSASVVVSAILCPVVTSLWANRIARREPAEALDAHDDATRATQPGS